MPYLVACLRSLFGQVNTDAPQRLRSWDGWIGDTAHSKRVSDHNPDDSGAVRAIDITDDDIGAAGLDAFDATALCKAIVESRDPRVKYLIHQGKIWRSYDKPGIPAWTAAPYTGLNGHFHHLHVSVLRSADNDTHPWAMPREDDMTPDQARQLTDAVAMLARLEDAVKRVDSRCDFMDNKVGAIHAALGNPAWRNSAGDRVNAVVPMTAPIITAIRAIVGR